MAANTNVKTEYIRMPMAVRTIVVNVDGICPSKIIDVRNKMIPAAKCGTVARIDSFIETLLTPRRFIEVALFLNLKGKLITSQHFR